MSVEWKTLKCFRQNQPWLHTLKLSLDWLEWKWLRIQLTHSEFFTGKNNFINILNFYLIFYFFVSKNLRALAKMPVEYPYRKHTESLINERVAILKQSNTIEEAEKKIGMGQIEEVIIQAENELVLSRSILEWKAWEPLAEQAPANQWKWPI